MLPETKALLFINVLMNFCGTSRLPKLLIYLKEAGIYEALEKVAKITPFPKNKDLFYIINFFHFF